MRMTFPCTYQMLNYPHPPLHIIALIIILLLSWTGLHMPLSLNCVPLPTSAFLHPLLPLYVVFPTIPLSSTFAHPLLPLCLTTTIIPLLPSQIPHPPLALKQVFLHAAPLLEKACLHLLPAHQINRALLNSCLIS
uniref:Uncharacterized protein n=1 Tax=Cacopsylla melanoneura TaxID=428564 RepID=A0A8D8TII6_9HEMI